MSEKVTKGGAKNGGENPKISALPSSSKGESISITSFEVFEMCIIRASNLIDVHDSTETVDAISDEHYCDCYRAAVVLSISALDAFFRKLIVSEITKIISDAKKPLNKELSTYVKNLLNQDKLLDAARNYNILETIEQTIKSDFETKSFQGEWKITTYLNMIGYKDIFSEVAIKADINEKNLKRKLTTFTKRRHVIAHSGDYNLNQMPHKENEITIKYAKECIDFVRLFAATIHEIMEAK